MIIAVDGPAGSGKSTISKLIAQKLNIVYLDTGAMYRATTLYLLENAIDIDDEIAIAKCLGEIDIKFKNSDIFLNGKNVSLDIRKQIVNDNVSQVSTIFDVREAMVNLQRKMSIDQSVILDGRDIGTIVFPNADYKFYLVASIDIRAKRRYKEEVEKLGITPDIEEIKKSIEKRDYIDSTREISPLKKADDAIEIDTSSMNINEVVDEIMKKIR